MLPRVLEPEVMDSPDEAHDYDTMDHSEVNRRFAADLLAVWNGNGEALDVGTGTAQILIELCRQHPSIRAVGIDLARHMLKVGRENLARAGLQERVRLELCDAKKLPFAHQSFDAVISNSILHHIPDPFPVMVEMLRVLKRSGVLFVRDLLRPGDAATLAQLVHSYAGSANAHQQKMFADSLHAALTLSEVRDYVKRLGGDPNAVEPTSDRHWTWQIVRRKS